MMFTDKTTISNEKLDERNTAGICACRLDLFLKHILFCGQNSKVDIQMVIKRKRKPEEINNNESNFSQGTCAVLLCVYSKH